MAGLGLLRFRAHRILHPGWRPSPAPWKIWICRRGESDLSIACKKADFSRCHIDFLKPRSLLIMDWACEKCTYVNSSGDLCEVCEAPRKALEDIDSDATPWSCQACTFLNVGSGFCCKVCGSTKIEDGTSTERVEKPTEESSERLEKPKEESVSRKRKVEDEARVEHEAPSHEESSNALLRQLHMERMSRRNPKASSSISTSKREDAAGETIVFMTYNVWFREDLELEKRMEAIGDLVKEHQPHIICFQEVTTTIYVLFQRSSWWSRYRCSIDSEVAARRAYFCIQLSRLPVDKFYRKPFTNSIMGRELCLADLNAGNGLQLVVATSHLESPCPAPPKWDQMFSAERVVQAKEAFSTLRTLPNIIFGGDMNWDDKLDGQPPLPDGWYDAWLKLRPNEAGLTYDCKANPMLAGSRLQKRLDRIFYHLQDFTVESIEMIGTKPIPGLTYQKEKTVQKQKQMITLQVLPSDHFGMLLKLRKD